MNAPLASWLRLRDHLSDDLFGGPRLLKAAWVINLQKAGTLPFVLALMWAYDCWTATAWTYAALHGSYGLCWLLKDRIFPDPSWEKKITNRRSRRASLDRPTGSARQASRRRGPGCQVGYAFMRRRSVALNIG